jgi:hypothetical protein
VPMCAWLQNIQEYGGIFVRLNTLSGINCSSKIQDLKDFGSTLQNLIWGLL